MKIIVCGAGEVGANIARQLVYEDNDVTIIDESEVLLRSLSKTIDLKSICGKTVLPEILESNHHPWFIAVQFHPELKSRPLSPHPLFVSFIKNCKDD